MHQRPDSDKLLEQVQADEKSAGRGRLKLFFGASPGVGKTYTMLEAARQRRKGGWDVVIGFVETHGRTETQALLEGFEILPRRQILHKNVTLEEFDSDRALERRPRLLVVDELAHTNAEGLRHAKRWQDIEEILDAGVDVYTTLNVQHWESLNDVVAQITGVFVHETVPDTFLRRTHEMELVDLPPEDLLQRLKDGKVYRGEMIGRAAENFFKPGNLIALRELALRHTAERVDAQMQAFKARHAIGDVWHVGERLLVGVTGSPLSPQLVRAASRLANRMKAPWIAVNVESSEINRFGASDQARIADTLRMAAKLGAETVTLYSDNVTDELLSYAHARNVTHMILGKPARPRWKERMFGSIINDVARQSGNINLHIINGVAGELEAPAKLAPVSSPQNWSGIGAAAAVTALTSLICWPLAHVFDRVNLVMIYLLGVVLIAYRYGRRSAVAASVFSVAGFDFFFVPPSLTFAVTDTQYLLTFGIMLGVGLFISTMMGRLRSQTTALRERAERMRTLYQLSHDLSETPDTHSMLSAAHTQLEEFYRRPVLILTADNNTLHIIAGDPEKFGWHENEQSVIQWVFEHNQMAGAGSDTLSGARGLYVPMKGIRTTVGVLGLRPETPKMFLDPNQLQLLETFASEIGGALESTRMSEEMGRAEVQMERAAIEKIKPNISTKIADVVRTERILILPEMTSSEEIIRALVNSLGLTKPQAALRAILKREMAGPTLIGANVAIPHARINGIDGIQAAMAIAPRSSVHVWILFVSPVSDPQSHLAFLSAVAAFFEAHQNTETLAELTSPAKVMDFLR